MRGLARAGPVKARDATPSFASAVCQREGDLGLTVVFKPYFYCTKTYYLLINILLTPNLFCPEFEQAIWLLAGAHDRRCDLRDREPLADATVREVDDGTCDHKGRVSPIHDWSPTEPAMCSMTVWTAIVASSDEGLGWRAGASEKTAGMARCVRTGSNPTPDV